MASAALFFVFSGVITHFSDFFAANPHIFPDFRVPWRRGREAKRQELNKEFAPRVFAEPIFEPILYQKDERSIDKRGGICYNFHERQRRFPLREVTFEERTTGVPAFAFCRRQTFFHFFAFFYHSSTLK